MIFWILFQLMVVVNADLCTEDAELSCIRDFNSTEALFIYGPLVPYIDDFDLISHCNAYGDLQDCLGSIQATCPHAEYPPPYEHSDLFEYLCEDGSNGYASVRECYANADLIEEATRCKESLEDGWKDINETNPSQKLCLYANHFVDCIENSILGICDDMRAAIWHHEYSISLVEPYTDETCDLNRITEEDIADACIADIFDMCIASDLVIEALDEQVTIIKPYNKKEVLNLCEALQESKTCVENNFLDESSSNEDMVECVDEFDSVYGGQVNAYEYLCEDTFDDYLSVSSCFEKTSVQEEAQKCNASLVEDLASLDDNANDDDEEAYAKKLCLYFNHFLDCVENILQLDCDEEASKWQRQFTLREIEPIVSGVYECDLSGSGSKDVKMIPEDKQEIHHHSHGSGHLSNRNKITIACVVILTLITITFLVIVVFLVKRKRKAQHENMDIRPEPNVSFNNILSGSTDANSENLPNVASTSNEKKPITTTPAMQNYTIA